MFKIKLPFWNDKLSSSALIKTAQNYWEKVEDGLRWPLTQMDAETCTLPVLRLLAYQRDVDRYPGEPYQLFRLRVKYAFANVRDSGSVAGLKRIFIRLGIGYLEVEERSPERDWDVIILRLTDIQLSENPDLLKMIMEKYGRTCRRYEFQVINSVGIKLSTIDFNNVWHTDVARY